MARRAFGSNPSYYWETLPLWAKMSSLLVGLPLSMTAVKAAVTIALQDKLIYCGYLPLGARRSLQAHPEHYGITNECFRDRFISSTDGTQLQIWEFKLKCSSAAPRRPTLLYFQGNMGHLGQRMHHIHNLMTHCQVNVIALHYRGYGRSKGWSTERGILRDLEAFINHCVGGAVDFVDPTKLVLFGQSLGGAVAIHAAAKHPEMFSGLVVENTFESIAAMVPVLYPKWTIYPHLTGLLWNRWPSADTIRSVRCPTLFLSGAQDEIVPAVQMKRLFEMCGSSDKQFVSLPYGSHDYTWRQPCYNDSISRFVGRIFRLAS